MSTDRNNRIRRPRNARDRPHLFPSRPRRVHARFTDDEHAELTAAADRLGLTPTGFCAHAALAAARGANTGERMEYEALANLQAELLRLRVTINQTRAELCQSIEGSRSSSRAHAALDIAITTAAESFTSLDDLISRIDQRLSRLPDREL